MEWKEFGQVIIENETIFKGRLTYWYFILLNFFALYPNMRPAIENNLIK